MAAKKQNVRMTRREREKERHRHEILQAAERVFVEKGFDRATMEDIAREAEFSVGALYTLFSNKEVLRSEVMVKIGEDFLASFHREIEELDNPLKAIDKMIEARLRHTREHGGFLRLFMESKPGSWTMPDGVIPQRCRGLYDTYIGEVAALFQKAMARGLVLKTDPLYAALSLEGVINAFAAYWGRHKMSLPLEKEAEIVQRNHLAHLITKGTGKAR